MSSSSLTRWAGLAVMTAGGLLVVAELLELLPPFEDYPFSELARSDLFASQQALYLLGLILLSIGLVGLYARQLQAAGPLGLLGFLVAFVGTVFFAGFFWANLFVAPALAVGAPEFLDLEGRFPGFFASLVLYAVGWLSFGLASLRAGVYPRGTVALLAAGAAIDLLAAPLSGLVIDVAFVWLGFVLLSGRALGRSRRPHA